MMLGLHHSIAKNRGHGYNAHMKEEKMCEVCGVNPATVTLVEVVNGKRVVHHLCKGCAEKIAMAIPEKKKIPKKITVESKKASSLRESLVTGKQYLVCPNCDLTFDEFKKVLKFGCESCYETFSDALLPLFEEIHGSVEYRGKKPVHDRERMDILNRMNELEEKLKEAVKLENFEEAAKIRDELKKLEGKLK